MSKRTKIILELAKNATNQTTTNACKLPLPKEDEILISENNNTFITGLDSGTLMNCPSVIIGVEDQENCNNIGDDIGLYMETTEETKTYHTLVACSCETEDASEQCADLGVVTHVEDFTLESIAPCIPVSLPVEDILSEAYITDFDNPGLSSNIPLSSYYEETVLRETIPINRDNNQTIAEIQTDSDSSASLIERETIVKEPDLTKAGTIRKRKKITDSLATRKKNRAEIITNRHSVLLACNSHKCKIKCASFFTENRRHKINNQFWELSYAERRAFVLNSCERLGVKRRTTDGADGSFGRNNVFKFNLRDSFGENKQVCKHFYLTTLGYKPTNDRFVYEVLSKTPKGNITPLADKRGKSRSANFIQKTEIDEHIESYNPVNSHYRREHAPNIRYLPSDITVKSMHADFLQKFSNIKVSYNIYRCQVKKKNISFARLGNEECETCESMKLHGHREDNLQLDNCDVCTFWKAHIDLAKESRELYRQQAKENDKSNSYFSADLEKVIMLPRLDTFKKVLFTKRLSVYNESFVSLGKKSPVKPFAVLWHEGINGRDQEDITSAFYAFLKKQRDLKTITIWLDNCSSQNKNWCFLSFLVYVINSNDINAEEIVINYFEPGHTYMSADSFHHQVELSLKKQGKTYDFPDFVDAVAHANKGVVDVKNMGFQDFYTWKSFVSQQKLKQQISRIYLRDIVQVTARRGEFNLLFKVSYSKYEPNNCLDFLQIKATKPNGMKLPEPLSGPRGFPVEKKENILKNLSEVMPDNRKEFWHNIPTRND